MRPRSRKQPNGAVVGIRGGTLHQHPFLGKQLPRRQHEDHGLGAGFRVSRQFEKPRVPQGNRREVRSRPRRDAGDRRVHDGRRSHRIGQGFPRRNERPGQPFHNLLGLNRNAVLGQVPAYDFQHAHPYPGKAETRVRDLEDLPLLDMGIVTRHVKRERSRRVGFHIPQFLDAPLRRAAVGEGCQIHALFAPQPEELDGGRVVGGHGTLGIVLRRVGELAGKIVPRRIPRRPLEGKGTFQKVAFPERRRRRHIRIRSPQGQGPVSPLDEPAAHRPEHLHNVIAYGFLTREHDVQAIALLCPERRGGGKARLVDGRP